MVNLESQFFTAFRKWHYSSIREHELKNNQKKNQIRAQILDDKGLLLWVVPNLQTMTETTEKTFQQVSKYKRQEAAAFTEPV
jgi:hypothetical protein